MPRVAIYQGGNIMPAGTTDARVRPANFDTGQAIGAGLKSVGGAVSDYTDVQQQVNEIQDRAAVKDAANAVSQWFGEAGYTGPNAFFEKQGKEALLNRPMIEKGLDSLVKQKRSELKTENQRRLFDQAVVPQQHAWNIQIASHSAKEVKQYDIDESTSRVGLSGEMARSTYLADPEHGENQIGTGVDEIKNVARLQGWGPDKLAAETLKFTSGVYKDIASNIIVADPQNGPTVAEAFLEKHGGSMSGDDRFAVSAYAKTQRNSWEAEQRRIEAEARRQENEQKHDARDRAEGVYRNIHDGVVVDPKTLASAQADAKFAGDDALVESLRQGGLTNSVTQQWMNAPPPDLQNRVNELSAEITKAGGKVAADKIVERDALSSLLTKSRSELHSDALSWGAQHLGLSVKPLNLNDPSSIADRINVATTVQKRTGRLQVLTPDEVTATQQTLTQGTTNDKVGLAMRLAKLGPLALPAAEQMTNNAGFINLIGLATHSNKGVAASRVNQIVTGYEALKTKPKLIDKNQASQQFNQAIGNALQFLPQVREGVLSNAQALLASQANEHGWSEWGDAQGGWLPAINSALGAYSRDGKRVGGLWTYNGGITVLPENMTGTEFEDRISKAHGPEFRRAQNGDPVFGDGRSPTATDIKKMQWVPSGDGVYRLTDGNGFLKTKQGGFYEIDVGRLNFDAQLAAHGYVRR